MVGTAGPAVPRMVRVDCFSFRGVRKCRIFSSTDGWSSRPYRLIVFFAFWLALTALQAAEPVSLLDQGAPGLGWVFDNGQEFAGATGQLTVMDGEPKKGESVLRLAGNFSEGGSYVQMLRDLSVGEVSKIVLKVRPENSATLVVRLIDDTGQCHQKPFPVTPGEWQEVEIDPLTIAGGEHWGGAEDGAWHGAPAKISILLTNKPGDPEPSVDFAEIRAEAAK